MIKKIRKAFRIVAYRVRTQGVWVTMQWAYGRGVPKLTGVPMHFNSAVTPNLYVGPQYNARGKQWLERNGFNGDVNMRIEFDDAEHGLALEHYCYLPTVDETPPTIEHLQEGVEFIQRILDEGGKVYIHCMGGVGRAPSMAAAYFLSTGMTLEDSIAKIKKARPFITILPEQMERLQEFEALHHTENTTVS